MNEGACDSRKSTRISEFPDREQQREPHNPPSCHKASLKYHQIKCAICNHPQRDAIEQAFLDWARPGDLAEKFKLGHRTVVYRHAHALGLFKIRAHNARRALEPILEESSTIPPTASQIIRAVRTYACINEYGKWTQPSRRLIITHLDAKGNELPADKVDPDWRLARSPAPRAEESIIAKEEALAADAAPPRQEGESRKGDGKIGRYTRRIENSLNR